jgi:flagellar FliL protein
MASSKAAKKTEMEDEVSEKPKKGAVANDDDNEKSADGSDADEGAANNKKKKLKIIIAIVALLVLVGSGVGLYLGGVFSKSDHAEETATTEKKDEAAADHDGGGHAAPEKIAAGEHKSDSHTAGGEAQTPAGSGAGAEGTVFYDLPDFLVNLNNGNNKTSFLKVSVTLELAEEDGVGKIESMKPRIVDSFNVYLRELRPNDLRGSAGIYRLREELLMRVNKTVQPAQVNDILFREIIVQ